MLKSDSTVMTLVVAILIAAGIVFGVQNLSANGKTPFTVAQTTSASSDKKGEPAGLPQGRWAATAAGRVEPLGGEIEIVPETSGVVTHTFVSVGDKVKAGDLLFMLRDDEILARWDAARSEIDVRERERAEDPGKEENPESFEKGQPRRDAEDAAGKARLDIYAARRARDEAYIAWRKGTGDEAALDQAREALQAAEAALDEKLEALKTVRADAETPLPTRLEGGLESARDDLRLVEVALERTRVRAPQDGVVLDMDVSVGELATQSPARPAVRIGDTSKLEVRAELEERDVTAVSIGQAVVIRSNAFPGQDFTGTVTQIAPSLQAPEIGGRGPRKPADVDVVELKISLDGTPPLLPGMRVDVFFKPTDNESAANSQG